MGINPAMGMGMMGGSEDFYTQMLYQQMMAQNGGANASIWNTAAANGAVNGGGADSSAVQQQAVKGSGFGKALTYGIGAGAAVGAATYFTNNKFNAPVKDGKFTPEFMSKFSGEYAAMQNGNKLENFFKGLGTQKNPVTAENYNGVMDSIEEFIKSGDVDDLTDDAKQVLKKKFGLAKADKAALEGLHNTKLADMKSFLTDTHYGVNDLVHANNLNAKQGLLDSLDDIRDGWKGFGKGKDSIPAKLEYLREHGYAMGMEKADYEKLLRNADDITDVKELDDIFKKFGEKAPFKARKAALKGEVGTIEKAMQKFAAKWDKSTKLFGGGFKKTGNAKTMTALENALSAMKKGKAGKYGAIAAAGAAVLSFLV